MPRKLCFILRGNMQESNCSVGPGVTRKEGNYAWKSDFLITIM